jgi:hypothetical protein
VPSPPTTPPEGERLPISEAPPPQEEQKRLQDETNARRQEVAQLIARIPKSRQRQQHDSIGRIKTFLEQAHEAEERNDWRQASELAGRALVLARELK